MNVQGQARERVRRDVALTSLALMLLLLLVTREVLPQQGRPNNDPYPSGDPARVPPVPSLPSPTIVRGVTSRPGVPGSSVIEITSSLAELSANAKLLQFFDVSLVKSARGSSASRFEEIYVDASDIRKLAVRLLRGLSLPQPEKQRAAGSPGPVPAIGQMDASIAELDAAIQIFIKSSVLKESQTIDEKLLSQAGADLEAIFNRSVQVQKQAEGRMNDERLKSGKPPLSGAQLKSNLKPGSLLQLSIDCSAWSVDDLLKRPAESKNQRWVSVGKIRTRTRRHQLAQPLVMPIESCVDGEADEKAFDEGLHYVAIVKDFTSYEVKDRVFAYQVFYEIGLSRDTFIKKRFAQPVSFYYVDEAGDGGFELLKGPLSFGLLPDWAAELARKH